MKHILNSVFAAGLVVVLTSCASQDNWQSGGGPAYNYTDDTAPAAVADFGWPRIVPCGATNYTIYELQADSWDGHQLMARSAVGVQSAGQQKPTDRKSTRLNSSHLGI